MTGEESVQGVAVDENDMLAAMRMIVAEHPNAAWSFGTITNSHHIASPFGRGVSVTLHADHLDAQGNAIAVFEKALTFQEAARRACDRMTDRLIDDTVVRLADAARDSGTDQT